MDADGVLTYLPLDEVVAKQIRRNWTLERMVARRPARSGRWEPGSDAGESACGGSHRLFGLSVALNQYLKETATRG